MSKKEYLKSLFEKIGSELDEVFNFKTGGYSAVILDLSDPENRRTYQQFARAVNCPESEIQQYLEGKKREQCVYTGHLGDGKLGYIITIPCISEETPVVLGEEITHGEHHSHHQGKKSAENYLEKFHFPTTEFIGFLGVHHIARKHHVEKIEILQPIIQGLDYDEDNLDHHIGYLLAKQLIDTRTIPYEKIFHSKNQKRVWEIVNGIIVPKIDIFITENVNRDIVKDRMTEKVDAMGLKAKIMISKD